MSERERNEVLQLNGLTILLAIALIANCLIVGFVYRYHNHVDYAERKFHNERMKDLYAKERELKAEIIAQEGVKSWSETGFVKDAH